MSRIRTIKPEFWTDAKTGGLSEFSKCLFIGLLNHCDDYGVLEWSPNEWRAKIFPYHSDTTTGTLHASLLDELLPRGLIILFGHQNDDGETVKYVQIKNFNRHQVVNKPGRPLLKDWKSTDSPMAYANRVGAEFQELSGNDTVGLREDEFNTPELSNTERKGKEGNRGESPPLPPPIENSSSFLRPKNSAKASERPKKEFEKDFEIAWSAYGHKVKKPLAFKAFVKARTRASLDEILDGIKRYHGQRPEWQQIAHLATWLNGERWNDCLGEKPAPNGHDPPATVPRSVPVPTPLDPPIQMTDEERQARAAQLRSLSAEIAKTTSMKAASRRSTKDVSKPETESR